MPSYFILYLIKIRAFEFICKVCVLSKHPDALCRMENIETEMKEQNLLVISKKKVDEIESVNEHGEDSAIVRNGDCN